MFPIIFPKCRLEKSMATTTPYLEVFKKNSSYGLYWFVILFRDWKNHPTSLRLKYLEGSFNNCPQLIHEFIHLKMTATAFKGIFLFQFFIISTSDHNVYWNSETILKREGEKGVVWTGSPSLQECSPLAPQIPSTAGDAVSSSTRSFVTPPTLLLLFF